MELPKINPDVIKYKNTIAITVIVLVALYVAYIVSKSYRVSQTLYNMESVDSFVLVSSKLNNNDKKNLKLCDFYISSAFRPYVGNNQFFQYIDLSITEKILTNGVRSIYVDIFNDNMGEYANPVISTGIKNGQWKLSINTVTFEDLCKLLARMCFNAGYVNNYDDPFILILNLNVNGNLNCLNKMKEIIYTHLQRYLLSNKYTYGKVNIAKEPIKNFKKKILIFSSGGYQNSELEEFINYSWDKDALKKISYEALYPGLDESNIIKVDGHALQNYNNNNLTIVTPNESLKLSNIGTTNYNPEYFWESGCQLVCVNHQLIDDDFTTYITKFKNDSFIPKPEEMRGENPIKDDGIDRSKSLTSNENGETDAHGQKCPEAPSEEYDISSNLITYKNSNADQKKGLCFLIDDDKDCNCSKTSADDTTCPDDNVFSEINPYTITDSVYTEIDTTLNNYKLCCSNTIIPNLKYNNTAGDKYYITRTDSHLKIPVLLNDGIDKFDKYDGNDDEDFNVLNLENIYIGNSDPKELDKLEDKNICLLDINETDSCPKGWVNQGKTKHHNYNICCRNP